MLRVNLIKEKQTSLILGSIIFIFLIPSLIAQEAEIRVEHIGYGQTAQEPRFSIYNTGEVRITNVIISVDGKEYRTITGVSEPRIGFTTTLRLNPGEHLIEVRTPEGAYDSLTITISSAEEKSPITTEETVSTLQENLIWIIIGTLVIIVVMIVWLLMRKPKLEMEESQQPQYS
jgi:hypothetical protein